MTRGPTPSVNRPPYRPPPRSNSALTCSSAGRRTTRGGARHDVSPAVHSLWTPVWTQCGSVSTDRYRRRDQRVGAPEGPERPGGDSLGRKNGMADPTLDLATVWDQIRERLATSLSPQQNAMLNLTRPLGL